MLILNEMLGRQNYLNLIVVVSATVVSVFLYSPSNFHPLSDGPHDIYYGKDSICRVDIRDTLDSIHLTVNKIGIDSGASSERYIFEGVQREMCVDTYRQEIFCVSDIHGDFDAFLRILLKVGVIDESYKWSFGMGALVICGDVVDRGSQVTECLWLIYRLQKEAQHVGGAVHYLLGNHELMILTGDDRYLNKKYQSIQSYLGFSYTEFFRSESVLGRWMRRRCTVLKINDNLFLHGGISKEMLEKDLSLVEINEIVTSYLLSFHVSDYVPLIFDQFGPFWYRGYIKDTDMNTEILVDNTLRKYGVERIVFGHTKVPSVGTIYEGKLYSLDAGFDSTSAEGLLISGEKTFRVKINGEKVEL